MDERAWVAVVMVGLVSLATVPMLAAASSLLQQSLPSVQALPGGPPCVVGGNPDDRLCISSDQDNVAPAGAPWLTAVRYNSSANWTLTLGAWVQNHSALGILFNIRSLNLDMSSDTVLHRILNDSEDSGGRMTWSLLADTPYVAFSIGHVARPEAVAWRGQDIPFGYDASGNGTLTFVLTFTGGELWIDFPYPGGGTAGGGLPILPGLTNLPQLDLVPDLAQIAAFSCANVTLTDPRPPSALAATRLWVFDWGDGTVPTRTTSPIASHLYGSPGVYRVTMTVQDVNGLATSYEGSVDTTALACGFHVARSIGFVVLTGAFVGLLAASVLLPRKTKREKRAMRRKSVYSLIGLLVLVVVL